MLEEKPTTECYQTISSAYDYFNSALFAGQLPDVIITFHRQRKVMGYASIGRWVNEKRQYVDELAVNPEYFAKYPLIEICQTLCHEMTHIWQAHYGSPGRRGYHNAQWAKKMVQIGLIPSSTGKPGGQNTGEWMMDYVLLEGPFHNACKELLKKGYRLPWVDRYPVYRLELPITAYDDKGTEYELTENLNPRPTAAIAPMRAEKDAYEDDNLSELITSKPKPRSGRIKYACKTCHIQLWGKPGLNVVCGDCNKKLSEVI
ncbi:MULTISPECIES: SprT-like domain-containing protein [Thalassolituus]|uniref:SprT-like domain-containing protein n=1 Tax=Thalassolituus TaxID=187492 RepID=UPI0030C7F421